jgi:mannose-1-phosphate guanylyltransferase
MFIWRVDHLLELYKKYLPDQYKILMKIKAVLGTKNEAKVLATEFAKIKPISIDYGILEKLKPGSMLMIPASFTWRDVGSWKAIHEVSASHPRENVIKGKVMTVESSGNLVYSIHKEKMITLAGVDDMVVIDMEDTLFICPREKSQMVKKVISELKDKKNLNKFL